MILEHSSAPLQTYKKDYLTDYLQTISEKSDFKKWFFGHYHEDKHINSQFTLLYESIEPVAYRSNI